LKKPAQPAVLEWTSAPAKQKAPKKAGKDSIKFVDNF